MSNTMDIQFHNFERINLDRENWEMVELKKKKQKMSQEEVDRKTLEQGQSTWEKILSQDQERNFQIKLRRNGLAGNHILQMKEKSLLKEQEKQESKEDLEMLVHLDELHAQELRRQEEQKPLLKKMERKNRLEDISRMNTYREEQAEILLTEEEQTRLAHIEMEGKLLQRKADATVRFTRHRLSAQTVIEKLVTIKKEQATATAEREEQSLVSCLAKRRAGQVKLQKDAEKKAEALQSISAHRQKMIQERQRREEAERQSNADWLQAQKDADRSFLEGNKSKAQKTRKEKVQIRNFNDSLEAEKRQSQIQQNLTRLDHGTARHTLGGGVSLSCGEGSSYITADITGTTLIKYGRAIKKRQQDCKKLEEITLTNPDCNAILEKSKAVDINDTNEPLEQVTKVPLCPTPPPAELRKDSQRTIRVRKLISRPKAVSVNHSLESSHLDRENQVMAELRITKQKMAEAEERRRTVKVVLSTCDRVLRQDHERNLQYQLHRNALAGQHLLQMREQALQKAQEKRQNKKDLELRRNMDELHAQELRRQEEQKPLLKKMERKSCLEDISRMNTYRGEQVEILRAEKEQTKLACVEMEGKQLQRKADATIRVTRHRLSSKIVCDNLASLKKEQAAAKAERDEQSAFTGLAKRRAGQERQRKERAEKKAEVLQSISAHRQKMIQERQQREEAERLSNADYLQAKKDDDRAFLEEKELKAQSSRKEKVQLQNFNDSLEAEKRQILQTLTSKGSGDEGHTLGGGVNFSCDEGGGYITADTAATQLPHYGRANGKQRQELKREVVSKIGQIDRSTFTDHTLGGGVDFSCDEGSGYITADTAGTPLTHYGRANRKQICKLPPIANRYR